MNKQRNDLNILSVLVVYPYLSPEEVSTSFLEDFMSINIGGGVYTYFPTGVGNCRFREFNNGQTTRSIGYERGFEPEAAHWQPLAITLELKEASLCRTRWGRSVVASVRRDSGPRRQVERKITSDARNSLPRGRQVGFIIFRFPLNPVFRKGISAVNYSLIDENKFANRVRNRGVSITSIAFALSGRCVYVSAESELSLLVISSWRRTNRSRRAL